jgi:hypothetical protein
MKELQFDAELVEIPAGVLCQLVIGDNGFKSQITPKKI